MRAILLFLLLIPVLCFSQDTLITRSKIIIPCEVRTIAPDFINYLFSDGLSYFVSRDTLQNIIIHGNPLVMEKDPNSDKLVPKKYSGTQLFNPGKQSFTEYALINFVPVDRRFNEKYVYSIDVGQKFIKDIRYNENLQFKIYSEGRVTLSAFRSTIVDVKKGTTYWLLMDPSVNKFELVEEEKAISFFNKNVTTLYEEEDKENPVISNSKKNNTKILKTGSGFLLSDNGLIITNHHVIEKANKIELRGINGDFAKRYKAKVVLSDEKNDLAVLQLDSLNFKFDQVPYIIRTKGTDVGEEIFVLGYPMINSMGDEVKLTTGIISAKTGYQGDITTYQVSAPVQGGNSGGPLFDYQGNLLGIVNAKIKDAEGVTYAIKTNYLNALIDILPTTPQLNETNQLVGLPLKDQIKILSKFVYIIEIR